MKAHSKTNIAGQMYNAQSVWITKWQTKVDMSSYKPPPYFLYKIYLCAPIILDECHTWFHLYGFRWAVSNAK